MNLLNRERVDLDTSEGKQKAISMTALHQFDLLKGQGMRGLNPLRSSFVIVLALMTWVSPAGLFAQCTDKDGDGYGNPGSADCSNGAAIDCNDNDPNINPDTCADNDCDGFGNPAGQLGCSLGVRIDCDDNDPGINPVQCPDNDCDGYGVPARSSCAHEELDCDDDHASIFPGATEVCDCADTDCDCDNDVDEGFDEDGDGKLSCCGQDCDDADPLVWKGATEICDGKDNDCNGVIDDGFDMDGDGFAPCAPQGDCDDGNGAINPGASEVCGNSVDDNCDGDTDEGCLVFARSGGNDFLDIVTVAGGPELCNNADDDGDNFIDEGFNVGAACAAPSSVPDCGPCFEMGTIQCLNENETHCVPDDGTVGCVNEGPPGAALCSDGLDNDCDGLLDAFDPGCQTEELCDGFDNNMDGEIDELFPTKGDPCEDGVGQCHVEGALICTPDGQGVICSATAPPPLVEGPPGSIKCNDGVDNDRSEERRVGKECRSRWSPYH